MNKLFGILVGGIIVFALVLMYRASQAGTAHVFTPSQLVAQSAQPIPRLRVAGRVSAEAEVRYVTEPRAELRFSIIDLPEKIKTYGESFSSAGADQAEIPAQSSSPAPSDSIQPETAIAETSITGALVPVVYQGLRPDMFEAGRDVIIDGEFKDGVVIASSLLTQCPSKYEAPSPEGKYLN